MASKRTIDTRGMKISRQKASELIGRSKNGESIIDELQAIISDSLSQEQPKNNNVVGFEMFKQAKTQAQETATIEMLEPNEQNKTEKEGDRMATTIIINEQAEPTDFDFMNVFDNIQIENDSRISIEDHTFCEEQEVIYKKLVDTYNNFIEQLQPIIVLDNTHGQKYGKQSGNYFHKQDTAYYHSLNPIEINKQIEKMKNKFISTVCYYFMDKYSITIDYEVIQRKYDSSISYEQILEEIFAQLGGYNFNEKAELEIKEKAQTATKYNKITIKNNKLILNGRYSYKDSIWNEYKLSGDFMSLFNALQLFDNGNISGNEELTTRYCGYHNERKESNYERYEPTTLNKVKSIKFFKNGKLEIEFISNQLVQSFAREYCGLSSVAV